MKQDVNIRTFVELGYDSESVFHRESLGKDALECVTDARRVRTPLIFRVELVLTKERVD